MLECVVNVSEGQDEALLAELAAACEPHLLDVHRDPHHHRSVFTLVGEDAPRALTRVAVARLHLPTHEGVHPRLGVVDVVPFVPLAGANLADAIAARDRYCRWVAVELGVPCFVYGPERSLPDVRRQAFESLVPACGPTEPHPTAGAVCAGARDVLVAYNVWLAEPNLPLARRIAAEVRSPAVRALGLPVGDRVQVSMNLVEPDTVGPAVAFDAVAARAEVGGAELVGLVPARVLAAVPPHRWEQLDLADDRTIEARLAAIRR
jgi:glutamate formiminotransferase